MPPAPGAAEDSQPDVNTAGLDIARPAVIGRHYDAPQLIVSLIAFALGGLTAIGTGLALALGRRAPAAAEVRPHAGRAPATAN
jgi:hypothetical protein